MARNEDLFHLPPRLVAMPLALRSLAMEAWISPRLIRSKISRTTAAFSSSMTNLPSGPRR